MAGLAASWFRTLQNKGLEIIQVVRVSESGSGLPTLEEIQRWRAAQYATYFVVRDPQNQLPYLQSGLNSATILIDRDQAIAYQGQPSPEELLEMLQDLLLLSPPEE